MQCLIQLCFKLCTKANWNCKCAPRGDPGALMAHFYDCQKWLNFMGKGLVELPRRGAWRNDYPRRGSLYHTSCRAPVGRPFVALGRLQVGHCPMPKWVLPEHKDARCQYAPECNSTPRRRCRPCLRRYIWSTVCVYICSAVVQKAAPPPPLHITEGG